MAVGLSAWVAVGLGAEGSAFAAPQNSCDKEQQKKDTYSDEALLLPRQAAHIGTPLPVGMGRFAKSGPASPCVPSRGHEAHPLIHARDYQADEECEFGK